MVVKTMAVSRTALMNSVKICLLISRIFPGKFRALTSTETSENGGLGEGKGGKCLSRDESLLQNRLFYSNGTFEFHLT
jgi:hypothetical protein